MKSVEQRGLPAARRVVELHHALGHALDQREVAASWAG
jgi:hypothetical protein